MPRVEHTITKLTNGGEVELVDLTESQLQFSLHVDADRATVDLTRRDALELISLLAAWLERTELP